MIEQGIYFALGCIVTALCALGFLPILWNRALRLTRRRLQLQIPVSMQEILAERDQLRAEFAVERLRIEQDLERVQATKAADMAEIGRQSSQVHVLADKVAALTAVGQAQERENATLTREKREAEAELGALKVAIDDAHAALERTSQEAFASKAERDHLAALAQASDRAHREREEMLRTRLEAAMAQAARHEANGLSLRHEVDEALGRVRFLENEVTDATRALEEMREGSRNLETQPRSGAAGSVRVDALEVENASLRQALASLRPAIDSIQRRDHRDEKADAELRSSIHSLGLAIAVMAREARSGPQKPARPLRGTPGQQAVRVEAD